MSGLANEGEEKKASVKRDDDLTWLICRIECFHQARLREELTRLGRPEEYPIVYSGRKRGRVELKRICETAATYLPSLESNPKPALNTLGNEIPSVSRQVPHRAGMLAWTILKTGLLREEGDVTAARTAIWAGWQFMRWEGGWPMNDIDAAVKDTVARLDDLTKSGQWTAKESGKGKPSVNSVLRELYVGHGACGRYTPCFVMDTKSCHDKEIPPVPEQPPVNSAMWSADTEDWWWR